MKVMRFVLGACLSAVVVPAYAKVSAEEAKQLGGSTLTEFGAERAGNADGSIPAYTGGLAAQPGVSNQQSLPDPFASDKLLYSVDAKNVDRYSAILTAGTVAMIKKYPTFRVDVYPTHRTASYPQFVIKNILRNAVTAELIGNVQGDGVSGSYGGIPFPIPKNGNEAMWNATLKWQGIWDIDWAGAGIFIDAGGHQTLTNQTNNDAFYPYYDPARTSLPDAFFGKSIDSNIAPAAQDGSADLLEYPTNYSDHDQAIYIYTVGQRRVRLAPEFKYDTPVAQAGGAFVYDEISLFTGRQDRFDFKLVGKKEMLVPYNLFKLNSWSTPSEALHTPHHLNPDYVRFEKHRVWVVEATLKSGKRHIYSRRTFYIDEDGWLVLACDEYDQSGAMYRVGFSNNFPVY
ncbi:MAG: DUF1329 domain-containing protein, partial [Janthinobacterium lividum]